MGTDTHEVRFGLLPVFELDRDDTSWGAKLALVKNAKFKAALKLSYDNDLKTVVDLPTNTTINKWLSVGTDISWSHSSQTYAGGLNFGPTDQLTISPMLYYDTRARAAIFAAWVPKGHENWQLDIGFDQHRVNVGISTGFNLAALLKKR